MACDLRTIGLFDEGHLLEAVGAAGRFRHISFHSVRSKRGSTMHIPCETSRDCVRSHYEVLAGVGSWATIIRADAKTRGKHSNLKNTPDTEKAPEGDGSLSMEDSPSGLQGGGPVSRTLTDWAALESFLVDHAASEEPWSPLRVDTKSKNYRRGHVARN